MALEAHNGPHRTHLAPIGGRQRHLSLERYAVSAKLAVSSMFMLGRRYLFPAALLCSCHSNDAQMAISDVSPRSAAAETELQVTVDGRAFTRLQVDLDRSGDLQSAANLRVLVGNHRVPTAAFTKITAKQLVFELPELPAGQYPVEISRADGARARDETGITLVEEGSLAEDASAPAVADDDSPSDDSPADDDAGDDAAMPIQDSGSPPQEFESFSLPQAIESLSTLQWHEDDPTLTADRLEIYYSRSTLGSDITGNLMRSTRTSVDSDWDEPTPVGELNTLSDEATPSVSGDGLVLYFVSNRNTGDTLASVYRSERSSRDDPWNEPEMVPDLAVGASTLYPFFAESGLERLVTASDGDLAHEVMLSRRQDRQSPWSDFASIPALSALEVTSAAVLRGNLMVLAAGPADLEDLYQMQRDSMAAPFLPPTPLTELNSPAMDVDPWLAPEGDYIVFASDRGNGASLDLFEAKRTPR